MPARALVLVALAALGATTSAGCLEPAPPSESGRPHVVAGAFARNATQVDMEALAARLDPHGADLVVLESHPAQYRVRLPSGDGCGDVLDILRAEPAVATVGECRLESAAGPDGETPVSTSA